MTHRRERRRGAPPLHQRPMLALTTMALAGLASGLLLITLVRSRPPTTFNIILMMGLLLINGTSVGALISWALHRRLHRSLQTLRLMRQGLWVGILLVCYALLQLLRNLNGVVALALFLVFAAAEAFFLLRERDTRR
ncbi:hypothetical protein ARMA_1145 [Ardenticatena maritima]|uniref:Uncharacterized protein n=1 Tax=Ardenticatena maritima TaxID=872965 RepID=A0A0M8K861_9CHLR|nr:hypothetical protein [Ardenticatena maritima]KPL87276.1 hypothetical protein SE16_12325 [Ardenticatena maritima]GAP62722.1 hypothetical protein ARMA_1145 [Ardenticatena maritima]